MEVLTTSLKWDGSILMVLDFLILIQILLQSKGKSLSPSVEDINSYLEYAYTANNLKPFSAFAIKIVFAGDNPALAPRIEDLRVIAHS